MEGQMKKLHVLVMPFPIQGHVNPMLHFSTHLALHGVKVSFLLPHSFKANMEKTREEAGIPPPHQLGLDLHFLEIPDVIPPNFSLDADGANMELFQQLFEKAVCNRGFIEEIILRSQDGPNPISCIISHNFLCWTQDVANKLGIKRIWVSTNNATTFYMGLVAAMGSTRKEEDFVPSMDPIERMTFVEMLYSNIGESFSGVVNSFEGLESHVVDDVSVMGITKIRFLGPMLPPSFFGMDTVCIEASIAGASARKEEVDCIKWLDTRTPSSVLYISFGSMGSLKPDQLEEIASGIEMSQQAFLWVLRSPDEQYLPLGFLERSQGLGLIVSWAPQLRVLRHKSTGGYLSHCGWNSTIESICAGVPMLCLPLFAEQPENALLITENWKVGMALEKTQVGKDEKGVVMMVTKEEVERKARALMEGGDDTVVAIRERSQKLKESARKAIFGSTKDGIQKLIADLQEVESKSQISATKKSL